MSQALIGSGLHPSPSKELLKRARSRLGSSTVVQRATSRQQYAASYPKIPPQSQQSIDSRLQRQQDRGGESSSTSQYGFTRDNEDPRRRQEYPGPQLEQPRRQSLQGLEDRAYQQRRPPMQGSRQLPEDWAAQTRRPRNGSQSRSMPREGLVQYRAPRQLPRFSPPSGEDILAYNQVVNKEVISRSSGLSMGIINHFYTDPDTLAVVSANLRPKGIFGSTPLQSRLGSVLLETFCQVGDVVLVHDESVLDYPSPSGRFRGLPQDERAGLVNLVGCPILTSQGKSLGKVKSFSFSPDSGKIDCIQFDEIGLSWLLPALIGTWEIGVEYISLMDSGNALILLPGAEEKRTRVADGWLEVAFIGLQSIFTDNGIEQLSDVSYAEGVDEEWEAWRVKWAPYFLQHYNQLPPATRRDFDLFNKRYEQQSRFVQPKSLPPARDMPPEIAREVPQRTYRRDSRPPTYSPRQDPRQRAQPSGSRTQQTSASVPLFEQQRPSVPSFQTRDADGGFGRPEEDVLRPQAYDSFAQPGPQYDEWLEREQYREPMLRTQGKATASSLAEPAFQEGRRPSYSMGPASDSQQRQRPGPGLGEAGNDRTGLRSSPPSAAELAAGKVSSAGRNSVAPSKSSQQTFATQRGGSSLERSSSTPAGGEQLQDINPLLQSADLSMEEPLQQKDRDALWQEPFQERQTFSDAGKSGAK